MGLFKRKPRKIECRHKWKDFHWYIENTWDPYTKTIEIQIIEPYVCISCKARENRTLVHSTYHAQTQTDAIAIINLVKNEYKEHIRAKALVEDEINDFQLVDRDYLDAYVAISGMKKNS